MPYSIFVERYTEIENLHAGQVGGEFVLKSIGNRFILKTPEFSDFKFKTHFGFTAYGPFNQYIHDKQYVYEQQWLQQLVFVKLK